MAVIQLDSRDPRSLNLGTFWRKALPGFCLFKIHLSLLSMSMTDSSLSLNSNDTFLVSNCEYETANGVYHFEGSGHYRKDTQWELHANIYGVWGIYQNTILHCIATADSKLPTNLSLKWELMSIKAGGKRVPSATLVTVPTPQIPMLKQKTPSTVPHGQKHGGSVCTMSAGSVDSVKIRKIVITSVMGDAYHLTLPVSCAAKLPPHDNQSEGQVPSIAMESEWNTGLLGLLEEIGLCSNEILSLRKNAKQSEATAGLLEEAKVRIAALTKRVNDLSSERDTLVAQLTAARNKPPSPDPALKKLTLQLTNLEKDRAELAVRVEALVSEAERWKTAHKQESQRCQGLQQDVATREVDFLRAKTNAKAKMGALVQDLQNKLEANERANAQLVVANERWKVAHKQNTQIYQTLQIDLAARDADLRSAGIKLATFEQIGASLQELQRKLEVSEKATAQLVVSKADLQRKLELSEKATAQLVLSKADLERALVSQALRSETTERKLLEVSTNLVKAEEEAGKREQALVQKREVDIAAMEQPHQQRCQDLQAQLDAAVRAKEQAERELQYQDEVVVLPDETHAQAAQAAAMLQSVTEERDKVQSQMDTLLKRSGQNHVKRDWERLKGGAPFPAGSDLREHFVAVFLNFESFACDSIFALESLGHTQSAAEIVFVLRVMGPLYAGCKGYVDGLLQERREAMTQTFGTALPDDLTNDSVPKLFWFLSLQAHLPPQIKALTNGAIEALIAEMDGQGDGQGLVAAVHARMLQDTQEGQISGTENDLRVPQLVRALLLLFTQAALSDPNCFLQPAPGTRLAYHPDRCKEILSPGAKKHGLIKEGDAVEVVLCGLYFSDASKSPNVTLPVVPPLVRRLVGPAAALPAPPVSPAHPPPPAASTAPAIRPSRGAGPR